jgi:hypothetical protein
VPHAKPSSSPLSDHFRISCPYLPDFGVCVPFSADRPHLLSAESPLDPSMDVGKNSYKMDEVKEVFRQAYFRLHNACVVANAVGAWGGQH